MELASRLISTKYTKVGFYNHAYQHSTTKLESLNVVENKYLTLDQFCTELPKLIHEKKGNLKSKNKEIEDLLR